MKSKIFETIKGALLGIFLFIALCELYLAQSGTTIFRYQGF